MGRGRLYQVGDRYMVAKTVLESVLDEAKNKFPKQVIRINDSPYAYSEEFSIPPEVISWFREFFGE